MTRPAQVHPTAVVGAADIADTAVVGPFAVIGQDGGLPVVIGHGAQDAIDKIRDYLALGERRITA